jgi:hypothetical protein
MAPRLQLQTKLVSILGTDNVYFQPPPTVKMKYPCIVYHRDSIQTEYADDNPYKSTIRYQITVIDRDPDSLISAKVGALPMSRFERFFTADNLNHDVYTLYF